eukprot:s2043_g5.t1
MSEFIWQKNVVRATSLLTFLGVLVILVGVIVLYSQPGESSSPSALTIVAVPLILLAAAALLIFYLGVLIERQNLTDKLPSVTFFRVASVAVLTVLVVPAKNVAFTLLLFLCFMAVVLQIFSKFGASLRLRLAFVAFCDAVFNLAGAEATRWAGAAGDIAVARFNMLLFAGIGGTIMPLAQLLALRLPIPKLCKCTCVAYGALAVHSALILLQALGTEVTYLFNGGGLYFEGPSCVAPDVESPLTLVLGLLTSFGTAARYTGPSGPPACPDALADVAEGEAAVPLLRVHICPETPIETLFFFVSLGHFYGFGYLWIVAIPPMSTAAHSVSNGVACAVIKEMEATRVKSNYEADEALAAEAKASPQMYVAVAIAMVGAAMFGFDQGNFGNVQAFKSFRREWCLGRYGDADSCGDEGSLDNDDWNDHFVTWGATLITFGAAAGRRPCIQIGGAVCFIGCIMASYASFHSVEEFFIGRFITGQAG